MLSNLKGEFGSGRNCDRGLEPPTQRNRKLGCYSAPGYRPRFLFSSRIGLHATTRWSRNYLLWDASDLLFSHPTQEEIFELSRLERSLKSFFGWVDVEKAPLTGMLLERRILRELLDNNAIKHYRGEELSKEFIEQNNEHEISRVSEYSSKVAGILEREKFDWILIPGGLFGRSCVYTSLAERMELDCTTYDSDFGFIFTAHQGISAHLADVHVLYEELRALPTDHRERIYAMDQGREKMRVRSEALDPLNYQRLSKAETPITRYDIVVPLNCRSDTAALCRQDLFASVEEWIRVLGSWAMEHQKWTIVFRQHPAEPFDFARGSDDIDKLLRSMDPGKRILHHVRPDDPTNTYSLLDGAKVVLPYSSTVGIDSVAHGVPVITHSRAYYRDWGFTTRAKDVTDYLGKAFSCSRWKIESKRPTKGVGLYRLLRYTGLQSDRNSLYSPQ